MSKTQQKKIKPPPKILIVDDDEIVTQTLTAYLQLETDYEIYTCQSPQAALNLLKRISVDVVISDFLMQEMNGLQFLGEVESLYPETTRILLTGYADKENAIKAINEVNIFQYIEKPWDNEQLKLIIRNGLRNKNLNTVLQEKISELDSVLLERDTLAEQNEMLKEELLLARNVQESMLPQTFPGLNGLSISAKYLPALEVGGDFYDVVPLANEHAAVLMADVTGHGIKAALITVLLKSEFSTYKGCQVSPTDIILHMNKVLKKVLPKGLFVAALVMTLNLKNGHCRIVNGGVPYPYLVRLKERSVERIHANGLLLGVADDEMYTPGKEFSVQLQKGDRLILFTDGLSEAENEREEHFDAESMADCLLQNIQKSSVELLDDLTEAVAKFSKPEHRWDDIAILGIEST
ncbi:MAG: SpoIIE family protein phosphatase [bacterium]